MDVEEQVGLADQIRRAVVSLPSNIAEGNGRNLSKEYAHSLSMARGSLYEVMTQLELAHSLGLVTNLIEVNNQATEIAKILNTMISRLSNPYPLIPNP